MQFYFSYYLKIKYTSNTSIIINIPTTENHTPPFFSKNEMKGFPNFTEKQATIKNLKPREIKQIIKKVNILKFIIPLVIVKILKGRGVKPARNSVPNHKE